LEKTGRSLIVILCIFSWISLCGPIRAEGKNFTIKFATIAPEGSTWMEYLREIDRKILKKTNGRVKFRVYAGGIAGDELDVLRKMRIGQIHAAAFSGVGFGQILPMVRVLDLPFLFRNPREIDMVHRELKGFFSERFREKGFELISWAEVGNAHLFSKKPIYKVEDLSRVKVWTWSGDPLSKETFRALGANPIPLSITDVTTALNTGMVDTVYAPPLGALALQWYRYVSHMNALPLAHSTGAVLLSASTALRLGPELLELIRKEFEPALVNLTSELRQQAEEAINLIGASGVKIIPVPKGKDLRDFYSIHDKVAKVLAGRVYPSDLLERVYEILRKSRQR